jgi:hypothetical protein
MAFGINAGIVPLLFLQTLYPQFSIRRPSFRHGFGFS